MKKLHRVFIAILLVAVILLSAYSSDPDVLFSKTMYGYQVDANGKPVSESVANGLATKVEFTMTVYERPMLPGEAADPGVNGPLYSCDIIFTHPGTELFINGCLEYFGQPSSERCSIYGTGYFYNVGTGDVVIFMDGDLGICLMILRIEQSGSYTDVFYVCSVDPDVDTESFYAEYTKNLQLYDKGGLHFSWP